MGVRLFVGNLPYDATEDEIRDHFSSVGALSYVSIPLDRETGKKRGFAFVEFAEREKAEAAIRQVNNQPFKGRSLAVNEARAKETGVRPATGFRPAPGVRPGSPPGVRPGSPPMRGPSDFADPAAVEPRGDRRKNFGPDAKPARSRSQRFKPEGGKKAFKEKFTGQIFGVDDEADERDLDIDNFATGLDQEEKK
jgi:RNA recognition motif-containing protein